MKIKELKNGYKGISKGFKFEIVPRVAGYYVIVSHSKKDVRFNTLWNKFMFKSVEAAASWCEKFEPSKFDCIGEDVVNH